MNEAEAPTDAALARRAAGGDERAFSELVRRHKGPLYRLLRRYTDNPDDAYEAAQEAFIAAWFAVRRFDPDRPFVSWLRTIAINKARDLGRRAAVRRLVFGLEGLDDARAQGRADPAAYADEVLAKRQDMKGLDRAIARLPTKLKEALLLTAFDGMSQQEAGEILRVSAKTVETRVYRARKILAQTLGPDLRPKS